VFPVLRKRRRPKVEILQGELKKIKLPSFNSGHKKGEEDEVWLL
jgi:hypothetical protein